MHNRTIKRTNKRRTERQKNRTSRAMAQQPTYHPTRAQQQGGGNKNQMKKRKKGKKEKKRIWKRKTKINVKKGEKDTDKVSNKNKGEKPKLHCNKFKIATWNTGGRATGGLRRIAIREEIEMWMKDEQIKILTLQETQLNRDDKEPRKTHTFYHSTMPQEKEYTHGVGFCIDNKYIKYLTTMVPISDRIIIAQFRYIANMSFTIIGIYAPHASRPQQEKDKFYKTLNQNIKQYKGKGPMIIMGDTNARPGKAMGPEEKKIIGEYTLLGRQATPHAESEGVKENRRLLIDMCIENGLMITNTQFRKQEENLITCRAIGINKTHPLKLQTHYQIDHILTTSRWRNGIMNVQAENRANLVSDHNPVWAQVRFKLKAGKKGKIKWIRYHKCTEKQAEELRADFGERMGKPKEITDGTEPEAGMKYLWNKLKQEIHQTMENKMIKKSEIKRKKSSHKKQKR